MKRIAILASGSGSNAENIVKHFNNYPDIEVSIVISNKADAYVLTRMENLSIPTVVVGKNEFTEGTPILDIMRRYRVDWIILAGFLLKVPDVLIENYSKHIVNIHPSLLPKFGGKGMYGDNVHKAVIDAKEKQSGITIHYINEHFDEGEHIAQFTCDITPDDTWENVAEKVHALEYKHYPEVIAQLIEG